MVYYNPYIPGQYNPPYIRTNRVFFHCSLGMELLLFSTQTGVISKQGLNMVWVSFFNRGHVLYVTFLPIQTMHFEEQIRQNLSKITIKLHCLITPKMGAVQ